jgi:ribosomal L18e/L15-like protein
MPMGPFRTHTTPVNVGALDRFDAGVAVTPDLLRAAGIVGSLRHPVKILGDGELSTKLTVHAHAFSRRAAEAIESAGGKAVVIGGGPAVAEPEKSKRKPEPAEEPAAEAQDEAPDADEAPEAEAETAEADAEPETETEE